MVESVQAVWDAQNQIRQGRAKRQLLQQEAQAFELERQKLERQNAAGKAMVAQYGVMAGDPTNLYNMKNLDFQERRLNTQEQDAALVRSQNEEARLQGAKRNLANAFQRAVDRGEPPEQALARLEPVIRTLVSNPEELAGVMSVLAQDPAAAQDMSAWGMAPTVEAPPEFERADFVQTPEGPGQLITLSDGTQQFIPGVQDPGDIAAQNRLNLDQAKLELDQEELILDREMKMQSLLQDNSHGYSEDEMIQLLDGLDVQDYTMQNLGYILDKAYTQVDWTSVGPLGSLSQVAGIGPGANLAALLAPLRSNEIMNTLKEARDNSPDGSSGYGQITQKELDIFETSLRSLTQAQGPEQLKDALMQLQDDYNRISTNIERRRQRAFGKIEGFEDRYTEYLNAGSQPQEEEGAATSQGAEGAAPEENLTTVSTQDLIQRMVSGGGQ